MTFLQLIIYPHVIFDEIQELCDSPCDYSGSTLMLWSDENTFCAQKKKLYSTISSLLWWKLYSTISSLLWWKCCDYYTV